VRPSERFLARRLRQGEREACRELIARHHRGVYGYLRHLGAGRALAEDLTQDAYAKAWRGIDSLRRTTSLRSWLLTIARNEYLQQARVSRPEVAMPEGLPEGEETEAGPREGLLRSERDRALRRAVARLEPTLRETVALHYFLELSLREVGAVLGVPPGTVKSRLHRALGRLRELLDHEEAEHDKQRAGTALARDP